MLGKSVLVAILCALPSIAFAQASITGVVRDTSGAVLPGVTVEAASPALIEKVRVANTDDTGQYRFENLRPGIYSVTFSLGGFSTVRREGIELAGTFVATVNADLQVGELSETITVTGETPIVDVQSASRQAVIRQDVIDALPSGRNAIVLTDLIPGVQAGRLGDVGGTNDIALGASTTTHGSAGGDTRLESNGLSLTIAGGANQFSQGNMSATQEVTVDTSGISAEVPGGGVRINAVPREGGNTFSGTFYASFINEKMQGDNFNDALRQTVGNANKLKRFWDINPGFGGPILRDKLWFFAAYKDLTSESYAAGVFVNKNANNPNVWTYEPDRSSRPFTHLDTWDLTTRVTWQATQKLKIGVSNQEVRYCACTDDLNSGAAPEAIQIRKTPLVRHLMSDWTAPLTNRLLLDGGVLFLRQAINRDPQPQYTNPQMISVREQSLGNFVYRAIDQSGSNPVLRHTWWKNWQARAAASYITGAHSMKTGISWQYLHETSRLGDQTPNAQRVTYRFNNGVPNQITVFGYPVMEDFAQAELGIYIQDKWTIRRLTVNGALRYDYHADLLPEAVVGPTPLLPNRNLTFPKSKPVAWHDITPRAGAAYDLFGTGKTALKVSVNKYLNNYGRFGRTLAPSTRLGNSTTRNWTDANRDFVPQCDLVAPQANGECGPLANQNFGGSVVGDTYDQELLFGWGKRGYNWEFSTGVQHALLPRVSVDVGYFRRSYGNFFATDNRAVTPADFTEFSLRVPDTDPRLPTRGQVIGGFYDLNPNKVGQLDNFVTAASNYGDQSQVWQGFDLMLNARLAGLLLQGGSSTGRGAYDSCEIRAKLPESSPTNPFCEYKDPWATDVKFLAAYTVPRIDVQVSGVMKHTPNALVGANFVATNALVAPSLGRPLSGNAQNVTVQLVPQTAVMPNHVDQFDMRVGKILRLPGGVRTTVNLDVYNVLNSADALTLNQTFGGALPWLTPRCSTTSNTCDTVIKPRLFKISTQIDF